MMSGKITEARLFKRRGMRWALFVVPLLHIVLVWTNGDSGLVWTHLALKDGPYGPELALTRGPAFWMNQLYAYGTLVVGQVLLGVGAWRARGERRLQFVVIFIAALFPWVGNIVTIFLDTNAPADLTPVFFLFTGGAVAFAMLRFRLFRLAPIAREVAMEELSEGVIVVGMDGRVVDMNNASDAMPDGEMLRIESEVDGDACVVRVRDAGTGMSPQTLAHCFDPFYSTKGDKGTGLGLALVASKVERYGGTISVDSTLGVGTTFTLRLPIVAEHSATKATLSWASAGVALRVLVVDDETAVREVMSVVLKEEGHLVFPAASGREALTLLSDGAFDVLVTDLAMDGLRGDQLAVEAKRLHPGMPVVLVTGFLEPGLALEGVDAVLPKPVSAGALREAVAEYADRGPQRASARRPPARRPRPIPCPAPASRAPAGHPRASGAAGGTAAP